MYRCITPEVTDISGISSVKIIVGTTYVGDFDRFAVTVLSSATQVITYRIQLSPYDAANDFATAGNMQTATNVAIGTTILGKTTNYFTDNVCAYLRIEASAVAGTDATVPGDKPIRVAIHGMKRVH